jgi:hypothetical protein
VTLSEDSGAGAHVSPGNRADDAPILPDTTSDERAEGWGEHDPDDVERYLRERPPHHGD